MLRFISSTTNPKTTKDKVVYFTAYFKTPFYVI